MASADAPLIEDNNNIINNHHPTLSESVGYLLDASPHFLGALGAAFNRYQSPPPDSTIPPESLLPALHFFLESISEELDSKAGKLCLRPIMQEDLDVMARSDPSLDLSQPTDADKFHKVAVMILKHIALERGKRLGMFVVGGIFLVHFVKEVLACLPFIGPLSALVNHFVPSLVVGPALGIVGAMYM